MKEMKLKAPEKKQYDTISYELLQNFSLKTRINTVHLYLVLKTRQV